MTSSCARIRSSDTLPLLVDLLLESSADSTMDTSIAPRRWRGSRLPFERRRNGYSVLKDKTRIGDGEEAEWTTSETFSESGLSALVVSGEQMHLLEIETPSDEAVLSEFIDSSPFSASRSANLLEGDSTNLLESEQNALQESLPSISSHMLNLRKKLITMSKRISRTTANASFFTNFGRFMKPRLSSKFEKL